MHKTISLALLLASGAAVASDWVSLGSGNHGKSEEFVDVSSIRIAGPIRRAWTKTILAPQFQKGTGADAGKWWEHFISHEAFNCNEETSRRDALTVYFNDGTSSPQPASDFPTPWQPVVPDTIVEAEMQFVCAWKPK